MIELLENEYSYGAFRGSQSLLPRSVEDWWIASTRLHFWQGTKTSKPPWSAAQCRLRSAHTGSDTHTNKSSTWPYFACLFNISTANAPEIFPILALRDFVQCPWHFPSTPDAPQLWMVIFILYFHHRLEPWALASHSLLFCPNGSQLSGRGSDHSAWVWKELHLVLSLPSPPYTRTSFAEAGLTWEV